MSNAPTLASARRACNRISRTLGYRDQFHRIAGVIKRPATHSEISQLRRHSDSCNCVELATKGWYHPNPQAAYLSIVAPRQHAIDTLTDLGWKISYIEIARDFRDPKRTLEPILRRHFIHKHQRRYYRYQYPGDGAKYTAPRPARRNFVHYRRVPDILHLECRLRREAVRNIGINDALDLTTFDHDQFWQQQLSFRGLSRYYSCRYLGGIDNVESLWRTTLTIQGMLRESRRVVSGGWQRDRIFPPMTLLPTTQGWRLQRVVRTDMQTSNLAHNYKNV
jgi:hypothetical protein